MRSLSVTSHNKSLKKIPATELIASELKIALGTPVWEVIRTRYANDVPVAHEHVFFPTDLIGTIRPEDLDASLYDLLGKRGIHFAHADQRLDAINADETIANFLNIPVGHAVIKMHVTAYMENGTPFNTGVSYYQTQAFKLVQTVYGN
ncbi:UTRA domain-containing protein [Erysipelothrix sp. HDW6C]|uniref:UTRA domain-containing protein n=1 Tax=Erysipelothrix sp. HDW6C TaxID=2714930 RepID=UPI001408759A|nr:UTRA domain-containing protein [Erysipelothrix sp. HDW6C]QIK69754.1 UTRA domain-containing protein [Erysipelothrix sp. HDW6C]